MVHTITLYHRVYRYSYYSYLCASVQGQGQSQHLIIFNINLTATTTNNISAVVGCHCSVVVSCHVSNRKSPFWDSSISDCELQVTWQLNEVLLKILKWFLSNSCPTNKKSWIKTRDQVTISDFLRWMKELILLPRLLDIRSLRWVEWTIIVVQLLTSSSLILFVLCES